MTPGVTAPQASSPDLKKSKSIHKKQLTDLIKGYEEEETNELDKLGDLELDDLDNLVNFADNIAAKLAIKTRSRLNKLRA